MPGSRLSKSFQRLALAGLVAAAGSGLSADIVRAQARLIPAPTPESRGETGDARTEAVQVTVDHAKVLRLPEKAQTVIVGNPAIADVTVQRNGVMIVTGKSYGVTNLIALDATGALLAESSVRVGAASDSILTVQRGLERESYSCTPNCQPSAQLGDSKAFFDGTSGQSGARNAAATGAEKK
ncbi:Pilus formation protein N terminal region [Bosea sp. 62]|nr:Pilus formation protein N terminal region [Bosea sp. 21B]CAD5287477.1 Pilus formation protein N terminal region [Bosea sp. 46]CAD5301632.1 Pilus formation protein N terminal region [Bosea sp. 7B]VVT51321.1 Pilus formation protein N terminal region [Bosea sp. EC-HK365B]VXB11908.1 Pilus formation protein N terminal region [Bosea sp. 62]VXB73406.1 Pilus formation protein N terminal region [Bosea sp. 127]VXC55888.1 Pilus formation protein N terminal region [Bosea sp. 29B]VXC89899.1 Pilus form